jgi:hypothetical protein
MPRRRFITGSAEGKAGACRDTVNSCNAWLVYTFSIFCTMLEKQEEEERWSTTEENNCTSTGPRGRYET